MLKIFKNRKKKASSKLEELNTELKYLGSSIILTEGRSELENRFNQFYGFDSIDFWMNDICVQSYTKVNDITQLAGLIHGWCELKLSGYDLEARITDFKATENMILVTSSTEMYLENNWNTILQYSEEFSPLIELLKNHTVTKNLMAFNQLSYLGLSRFIGGFNGTFINDLPRVRVTNDGRFKVMSPEQAFNEGNINNKTDNPEFYLGVGNAREALQIIVKNLPSDIEPARLMTENDLKKY